MNIRIATLGLFCAVISFVWSGLVFGVIGFVSNGTWLRTGDLQMIVYWLALALGPQVLAGSLVAIAPLSRPIKAGVAGGFLLGMLAMLLARML